MQTYLIDLDHTLINTTAIKQALIGAAKDCGVPEEVFTKTYRAACEPSGGYYGYDNLRHAKLISNQLNNPTIEQKLIDGFEKCLRISDFVYPDSLPFLERIKKHGDRLVIMTRGEDHWQNLKLSTSGLDKLFDQVIISPESKEKIITQYIAENPEDHIFISDNGEEINKLKDLRIKIIQIVRPGGKYQDKVKGVNCITSFDELGQTYREFNHEVTKR